MSHMGRSGARVGSSQRIARLALVGVVLAVVVIGLMAPISAWTVRSLLQEERSVTGAYRQMQHFDELRFRRYEAEAYYQAYLASASPTVADAFSDAMAAMAALRPRLREEPEVPAPQQLQELESALEADATFMRDAMDLRSREGEVAARQFADQFGVEQHDRRIAGLFAAIDAGLHSRIQALQGQRDWRLDVALKSSFALALALVGGLALLYRLARRAEQRNRDAIAQLRRSEERFRGLTMLSADWYWEEDDQFRFTYLSDGSSWQKAGYESSRNMGLTRRQIRGIDEASADWDAHEATCRTHQPFRDFTYRRIADDGSARWIRTSGVPGFDAQGKFTGYRGIASDITHEMLGSQELRRQKDLYAALSQTNRAIIHLREPQALFDEVCRVAVDYGHFCLAWIGIVDDAGWIVPRAIHGPVSEAYGRMRVSIDPSIPEGRGFAGQAVREGKHYVVNDFLAEPRTAPWREQAIVAGVRSLATFPLRQGGRWVGVLNLHGDETGFFTDELVALLQEMANNISFALDNLQREAERETAQRALDASEQKFRHLAANVPEIFWTADPDSGRITYVSPAYEKIFGRSASEVVGSPLDRTGPVHPEDAERVRNARALERKANQEYEFRILRPDGEVRWLHSRSFPVAGEDGRVVLVTGVTEDVTSRRSDEERLQYLAHYDSLTRLPNRTLFYDRLGQNIAHARRENRMAAVIFVDVDHFKHVNDTLGHAAGDRLLQQVAQRLEQSVRADDTVGRLGGDEFALILANIDAPSDAGVVAQKLMQSFREPFSVEGQELFVTASAGVTLFPLDSQEPDGLIKNADAAMYRAKELGRNAFQYFTAELNLQATERMTVENHLRRALERREFSLHYQPKVDLASGEISGLEALLRWSHPELGQVSPARFIPILEENGQIVQVGERVLEEVCSQIRRWASDPTLPEVPVAVNLSGRQLQQKDIGAALTRIVAASGVDPRLIELEITESVLMRDPAKISGMLRALRESGMRVSVDDFGTGYSSLNYLKSFPLDALKIDRSFVKDIVTEPDDAMITRAVISMAHSLRLKVVAEGVESAAQMSLLAAAGCDEMQGFHFSRPLPAEQCEALMRQRRRLSIARGDEGDPALLVVDDDAPMRNMVETVMRREGLRVLGAQDAQAALEMLATNKVSVVLSDQHMPGMSGVELLSRVRGLYPDVVRLMMSGQMDLETVTQAVNQGAVYKVLAKSLSNEQLRAGIKEAFAHKALLDENRRLASRVRVLEAGSGAWRGAKG
jgi:diguanylate cyclase (GGDEF)-like protein/PAS domain S-box-containing protein